MDPANKFMNNINFDPPKGAITQTGRVDGSLKRSWASAGMKVRASRESRSMAFGMATKFEGLRRQGDRYYSQRNARSNTSRGRSGDVGTPVLATIHGLPFSLPDGYTASANDTIRNRSTGQILSPLETKRMATRAAQRTFAETFQLLGIGMTGIDADKGAQSMGKRQITLATQGEITTIHDGDGEFFPGDFLGLKLPDWQPGSGLERNTGSRETNTHGDDLMPVLYKIQTYTSGDKAKILMAFGRAAQTGANYVRLPARFHTPTTVAMYKRTVAAALSKLYAWGEAQYNAAGGANLAAGDPILDAKVAAIIAEIEPLPMPAAELAALNAADQAAQVAWQDRLVEAGRVVLAAFAAHAAYIAQNAARDDRDYMETVGLAMDGVGAAPFVGNVVPAIPPPIAAPGPFYDPAEQEVVAAAYAYNLVINNPVASIIPIYDEIKDYVGKFAPDKLDHETWMDHAVFRVVKGGVKNGQLRVRFL